MREFERLTYPLLDALFATALRMAGDPHTAEDVVQETALRAYRRFDTFNAGTNFKAWIFTILSHVMIDRHRCRLREPVAYEFLEQEPSALEVETPRITVDDVNAIKEAMGDEITAALMELPQPLRFVFLLSTVQGLSYREIAQIVEIPIGTVMSRLFRARASMRKALYEYAQERGYLKEPP